MKNAQSIETDYDILLPEYLYQNLRAISSFGYWTLASDASDSSSTLSVYYQGSVQNTTAAGFLWVRPVITVSKSNVFE